MPSSFLEVRCIGGHHDMKLWIGNIAPGTSDDEIRELVQKYAPGVVCAVIERVEGDGSRPAAMLEFGGPLDQIVARLNGMYWKERRLSVQSLTR
jgi:hypothetical protein